MDPFSDPEKVSRMTRLFVQKKVMRKVTTDRWNRKAFLIVENGLIVFQSWPTFRFYKILSPTSSIFIVRQKVYLVASNCDHTFLSFNGTYRRFVLSLLASSPCQTGWYFIPHYGISPLKNLWSPLSRKGAPVHRSAEDVCCSTMYLPLDMSPTAECLVRLNTILHSATLGPNTPPSD